MLPTPVRHAVAGLLFLAGARIAVLRAMGLRPVLVFSMGLLAVYAAIAPPPAQHWHMYGATLGVRATILVGACGTLECLRRERIPARGLTLTAGLIACLLLGDQLLAQARAFPTAFWLGQRHQRYTEVARYMREHMPRRQRFMAAEVGTLGYLTDHHMIDPFGLLNPTNEWPRSMRPTDYMDLVVRYQPDILLVDSPVAVQSLAAYTSRVRYAVVHVFEWGAPFSTLAVRVHPPMRQGGEGESASESAGRRAPQLRLNSR
jgi:hypothetical protein